MQLEIYGQLGQFQTEVLIRQLKHKSPRILNLGIDFNMEQLQGRFRGIKQLPVVIKDNAKVLTESEIAAIINGDTEIVEQEVEKPKRVTRKKKVEGAE